MEYEKLLNVGEHMDPELNLPEPPPIPPNVPVVRRRQRHPLKHRRVCRSQRNARKRKRKHPDEWYVNIPTRVCEDCDGVGDMGRVELTCIKCKGGEGFYLTDEEIAALSGRPTDPIWVQDPPLLSERGPPGALPPERLATEESPPEWPPSRSGENQ